MAHDFGRTGLLVRVRVPTKQEELTRLAVREHETISRARHQILNSAKGRALALGYPLPKQWWRPHVWPRSEPWGQPADRYSKRAR